MEDTADTAYDSISFTSKPSSERHPDRLSVIATLQGLNPKPLSSATVLEIGCSTGDNLLPLASQFPSARFVGIDASAVQIKQAVECAGNLHINNVNFYQIDLLRWIEFEKNLSEQPTKFDYIFCHGLYSWVSEPVRKAIWEIALSQLAKDGVLFLSYNTLPQNIWRETIRRTVRILGDERKSLDLQLQDLREVLRYFAENLHDDPRPYAKELKTEVLQLQQQSDSFLIHEILSAHGEGYYALDIANKAREYGLSYLGDARPSRSRSSTDLAFVNKLTEKRSLSPQDAAEISEQIRDLISPVSFRSSLFVFKENLQHGRSESDICTVEKLFVSSSLVPVNNSPRCSDNTCEDFSDPRGYYLTFDDPMIKTALLELAAIWPEAISIAELKSRVDTLLLPHPELAGSLSSPCPNLVVASNFNKQLLELFQQNMLDLYLERPRIKARPKRPHVLPIALHQFAKLGWATNLRHEYQVFDDFTKELLPFLDGTKTEDEIIRIIQKKSRKYFFLKSDTGISAKVRHSLDTLSESAFLFDAEEI